MKQFLYIFIALLTLVSCRQSVSLSEDDKRRLADEVSQTLHNYHEAVREEGLIAEFKYLDSSADFFWLPPGFANAISFDSVATILRQSAPHYQSINNNFDTLQIIPLNKELASYTSRINSAMTSTNGERSVHSLVETGVLIKRNDGWKLLHGQTSISP